MLLIASLHANHLLTSCRHLSLPPSAPHPSLLMWSSCLEGPGPYLSKHLACWRYPHVTFRTQRCYSSIPMGEQTTSMLSLSLFTLLIRCLAGCPFVWWTPRHLPLTPDPCKTPLCSILWASTYGTVAVYYWTWILNFEVVFLYQKCRQNKARGGKLSYSKNFMDLKVTVTFLRKLK